LLGPELSDIFSFFFSCIIDDISSAMRLLTATFTFVTWWEIQCLLCPVRTPIPLMAWPKELPPHGLNRSTRGCT
jgi:hypothetical protein